MKSHVPTQKANNETIKGKPRICLITDPRPAAAVAPLSNLVDILLSLSSYLYLITGNEGAQVFKTRKTLPGYSFIYKPSHFIILTILDHIMMQLKIAYKIIRTRTKVDVYVVFFGGILILPFLVCKATRKPVIFSLASSPAKIYERSQFWFKFPILIENINYHLADRIVVYSPKLIKEWGLEKYGEKIGVASRHFIDFDNFQVKRQLRERGVLVGYIGRLSEEKGIINFLQSMPLLLKERNDVKFFIGGGGQLKDEIEKYLSRQNLLDRVTFAEWIPHNKLPDYLNNMRLLILPSYTEGLPNIMLEAMACGTPVLATPVGSIPDVIKDEKTGFIMENNSPECISRNILRALRNPNIPDIAQEARALVETEFTFDKAVERYQPILSMSKRVQN